MVENSVAIRDPASLAKQETKVQPFEGGLVISQEQINQTTHSLALLREMINTVLVEGVDYGNVPGVPDDFLWEPGADQIISGYNCRAGQARILSQVFTDEKISVVLEVPLLSFANEKEVACCVGAASTTEVKHKYRWLKDYELSDWGYNTKEQIATLKTKKVGKYTQYRINNPEPGDLLNTIWKIAFKRGRVGAAKLLPGVSSALREKFAKPKDDGKKEPKSDWDRFYASLNQRGLNHDQACQLMGVKFLKAYVAAGHTLDQALQLIDKALAQQGAGAKDTGINPAEDAELPEFPEPSDQEVTAAIEKPAAPAYKTDPKSITTIGLLYEALTRDFPNKYKYKLHVLTALRKKEADVRDFPAAYRELADKEMPAVAPPV